MPINSFKEDEQHTETGKMKTLLRLFSYLLNYKKQIVLVLLIMAFCVCVDLLNPLIIESAIDDYITKLNLNGLLYRPVLRSLLCLVYLPFFLSFPEIIYENLKHPSSDT